MVQYNTVGYFIPSVAFSSMRLCINEGRKLASLLSPGTEKGELLALSSEAEVSLGKLCELDRRGMVRTVSINPLLLVFTLSVRCTRIQVKF